MVLSEIFLDRAKMTIMEAGPLKDALTIVVNPRSISRMRGLNNSNIEKLKSLFHFKSIEVKSDLSIGEEELKIE